MPLPDSILRLVAKFDPSKARKEYETYKADWMLYRDLMELDRTRLLSLIQKIGKNESDDRYEARRLFSSAFNLIPTILNMTRGYLFAEEPTISVEDDTLSRFMQNCDGAGTSWVSFVRQTALPLSMGYGFVDILVQNPFIPGGFRSAQDEQDAGITPFVYPITPLQRLNWSARNNHEYNWLTFADAPTEPSTPFDGSMQPVQSYITVSAARPVLDADGNDTGEIIPGFWMRSIRSKAGWVRDGEPTPTSRAPVASLYYQRSNDPARRHFGVSKVAMISVLTLNTIQLLSWIYQDILANLSLLGIPTRDGRLPRKPDDPTAVEMPIAQLGAFSVVSWKADARGVPQYIQGATAHIKAKQDQVNANLAEIRRIAGLLGATGDSEVVTSGVQAVVNRTELFQEFSDQAGALDNLTLDVFALVKSWETDEDWNRDRLLKEAKPQVSFYKGPYVMDSLPDLILNLDSVAKLMSDVSPTLLKVMERQLAAQIVYADDPNRTAIMDEIEANSDKITPTIPVPTMDNPPPVEGA